MSKSLEALEIIKGTCQHLKLLSSGEKKAFDIIERDLKVLDILREKQVDLWLVDNCDYENYVRIRKRCEIDSNVYCDDGAVIDYTITKEEFELVQGWLDENED